jgi:hypothetical protein
MARGAMPEVPELVACMLAVAAVFLHTTLLDLDGDRRTGKRTSGVVLGPARARRLAALFALGGIASAGYLRHPVLLFATLGVGALAMASALLPGKVASRTVCVAGTAVFAAAAGIYVPPFPAGVLLLVFGTRLYFRHRFSLAYPAL